MARYEVGVVTPAAAAAAAFCDIRTGAKAVSVLELSLATNAAPTALVMGLFRPATTGTASTTTAFQPGNTTSTASVTTMGTAWSVGPTVGATALRRFASSNNTGAGVIWQWPVGGLVIPASSSLLLWCVSVTTSQALSVYAVIEE